MLDPDHVGALALLGEINIRRANFEEAAASLARLAKLEVAPAKNRVTAGIAAVDLYENKLGRFDSALEVLLALHKAKLSNLPVRERLARAAARTGSWKEATAILEELMHERPEPDGRIEAARLAMAIHRDRLGSPQDAAAAIVKLLEEAPGDGEALDMLLQTTHAERRSRTAPRERARRARDQPARSVRPTCPPCGGSRRSRALCGTTRSSRRRSARLQALGAADAPAEQAFAQLASKKARTPQVAVSPSRCCARSSRPATRGRSPICSRCSGPTLAEALGPNLRAAASGGATGSTRAAASRSATRSRMGRRVRHPASSTSTSAARTRSASRAIPGETARARRRAGVNAPLSPMTRARVARELLAMVRGTTVTRSRDDVTIAAIVVAACRIAEVPIEHPPYAVLGRGRAAHRQGHRAKDTQGAGRTLPRHRRARRVDARAWSKRALASHDRIAVLASGDPSIVLCDMLGVPVNARPSAVGNARAEELLRFVLSPQYLDLRRSLGLESA